jgi:hypothetical protein
MTRDSSAFITWVLLFIAFYGSSGVLVSGFAGPTRHQRHHQRNGHRQKIFMTTTPRMGELTLPEQKVFDIMSELHRSKYPFRAVLVGGRGAILESTHLLGPSLSVTQSPSTGANLLTLASADKTFELHIQLSAVSKVVLTTKTNMPEHKTLRIVRLLNATGDSICSLILAASEDEAVAWFNKLVEQFGHDIQL